MTAKSVLMRARASTFPLLPTHTLLRHCLKRQYRYRHQHPLKSAIAASS